MTLQELAMQLLGQHDDALAKAQLTTAAMAAADAVQLDFDDMLGICGTDETPLLKRLKRVPARAVTHRWREATIPNATDNASNEGSAAKATSSVVPAAVSNTCQIVKETIGVSRSALREAANGMYGGELIDEIAFQLDIATRKLMKDIEYSALLGVEDMSDGAGSPRHMKGLVGAVGTWNGFIQTNQVDAEGEALDEDMFSAWLASIWEAQAGLYPDVVVCSMSAARIINTFSSQFQVVVDAANLDQLVAGRRIIKYTAPWGGFVDVVPHPLCAASETATQNWMAAITTQNVALAELDPLHARKLALDIDGEAWEVIWEGTLQCRVEKSHGLLTNFVLAEGEY